MFRIICILNILMFVFVNIDNWKSRIPTKLMLSLNAGFIAMVILKFIAPSPAFIGADVLYPIVGVGLISLIFASLQLAAMSSLGALVLVSSFFGWLLVYGTDAITAWLSTYFAIQITEDWHKVASVVLVAAIIAGLCVLYYIQKMVRVTMRCVFYAFLLTIAIRSYQTVGFSYDIICCSSEEESKCPIYLSGVDYGVWFGLFVIRMLLYALVKLLTPPTKEEKAAREKLDNEHAPAWKKAARYFQGGNPEFEYKLITDRRTLNNNTQQRMQKRSVNDTSD